MAIIFSRNKNKEGATSTTGSTGNVTINVTQVGEDIKKWLDANPVTDSQIADQAVTREKLAVDSVWTDSIRNGQITPSKLSQDVLDMIGGGTGTTFADEVIVLTDGDFDTYDTLESYINDYDVVIYEASNHRYICTGYSAAVQGYIFTEMLTDRINWFYMDSSNREYTGTTMLGSNAIDLSDYAGSVNIALASDDTFSIDQGSKGIKLLNGQLATKGNDYYITQTDLDDAGFADENTMNRDFAKKVDTAGAINYTWAPDSYFRASSDGIELRFGYYALEMNGSRGRVIDHQHNTYLDISYLISSNDNKAHL